VALEEALGHAHATDVERDDGRWEALGVGWAGDELGGAPADVDDEEGTARRIPAGGRPAIGRAPLLLSSAALRANPEGLLGAPEEGLGVGGVPGRRGRHGPHRDDAEAVKDRPVGAKDGEGAFDRALGEVTGLVDPLAETGDRHLPLELGTRPV